MLDRTATTTAATKPSTPIDFACLAEAIRGLPPEPIGEWMRSYGFPPERWVVVLPEKMRAEIAGFLPKYVFFSPLIDTQLFVSKDALGLELPKLGINVGERT